MRYVRHGHGSRRIARKAAPPGKWGKASSGKSYTWASKQLLEMAKKAEAMGAPEYYTPNPGEIWKTIAKSVFAWSAKRPDRDDEPTLLLKKNTNVTVIKRKKTNRYGDVYFLVLVDGQVYSMQDDVFNSEEMKRVF